jgi:hypothetical protein
MKNLVLLILCFDGTLSARSVNAKKVRRIGHFGCPSRPGGCPDDSLFEKLFGAQWSLLAPLQRQELRRGSNRRESEWLKKKGPMKGPFLSNRSLTWGAAADD